MRRRALRFQKAAFFGALAWVAVVTVGGVFAPVFAQAPEATADTTVLTASQESLLRQALERAASGNWNAANALARQSGSDVGRRVVEWRYLTASQTRPSFDQIIRFVEANPEWPRLARLLRKAEEAMPKTMRHSQIIAWFAGREPITGDGKIRLGEAYLATGDQAFGETWIRRGWEEHDFGLKTEQRIVGAHGGILSGEPHVNRLDRLIWDGQYSQASRQVQLLGGDWRKLANARLKLLTSSGNPAPIMASVPRELQNDHGLLYGQIRTLRKMDEDDDARRVFAGLPVGVGEHARSDKWWDERHILARRSLSDGLFEDAYSLAANHGIESGSDYAEAEWFAGWVALRFLEKPDDALIHFQKLYAAVRTPISLARAAYWSGRAADADGDAERAKLFYELAAKYPTAYYGQLAAQTLQPEHTVMFLPLDPSLVFSDDNKFKDDEIAVAARILSELGQRSLVRSFILHLADEAESMNAYAMIGALAIDLGFPNYGVKIAKKALRKNVVIPALAYPVVDIPDLPKTAKPAEPALVLGLSRQESEFNARAVSSAGARGLMQLMPGTARIVARQHKLTYNVDWLLDRPEYNAQLGTAHLGDLIVRFDGSYILAIAAYNAGARRSEEWILEYGDPRLNGVDPIDWVEQIPFGETRNYVQRVLENTQVYRARLAGGDMTTIPVLLSQDLNRDSGTPQPTSYERLVKLALGEADDIQATATDAPVTETAEADDTETQELASLDRGKQWYVVPRPKPDLDPETGLPVPVADEATGAIEGDEIAIAPMTAGGDEANAQGGSDSEELSSDSQLFTAKLNHPSPVVNMSLTGDTEADGGQTDSVDVAENDKTDIPDGCRRFVFDKFGESFCADDIPNEELLLPADVEELQ
jgi:soluble lytic murein transglycosylase